MKMYAKIFYDAGHEAAGRDRLSGIRDAIPRAVDFGEATDKLDALGIGDEGARAECVKQWLDGYMAGQIVEVEFPSDDELATRVASSLPGRMLPKDMGPQEWELDANLRIAADSRVDGGGLRILHRCRQHWMVRLESQRDALLGDHPAVAEAERLTARAVEAMHRRGRALAEELRDGRKKHWAPR